MIWRRLLILLALGLILTSPGATQTRIYSSPAAPAAIRQSARGLLLRTTWENRDQALFSADEIVLDDGQRVATWTDIVCDVTVAGAGGVDAGGQVASVWYSVYAIWNGTTRNCLLHREEDYVIDQQQNAGISTDDLRDAAARTRRAQSFQLSANRSVVWVQMIPAKQGAPVGAVWLTLEADVAGAPSGTALATSEAQSVDQTIGGGTTAQRFLFRGAPVLTAATTYWFVLRGSFAISGVNFWRPSSNAAGGYASGNVASWDGAAWTNQAGRDYLFQIAVAQNVTAVTMPAGYTGRTKVGYVYNDAASNLKPLIQRDRQVLAFGGEGTASPWYVGSLNSINATFISLGAFVPPTPVMARLTGNNFTAVGVFGLGHTRGSMQMSTGAGIIGEGWTPDWDAGIGITGQPSAHAAPILVEHQLMTFYGTAQETWVLGWDYSF